MKALKTTQKIYFPSNALPHLVDPRNRSCTCPQFIAGEWCEHLKSVGQYPARLVTLSAHPSFSQALSGLVKSIRVRNIEEAAYWLHYSWGFREKLAGSQFRIVRRLLIGSAEDGHSIAVMQLIAQRFSNLLRKDVEFSEVVAELVRICKIPNWWVPQTGGHDYIYSGMLATRKDYYDLEQHSIHDCVTGLKTAVENQDKVDALRWILSAFEAHSDAASHLTQTLLELSIRHHCQPAFRLITDIAQKHARALKNDNNFLCQAAWFLTGGQSSIANYIEPVTPSEVSSLIDSVTAAPPHVIPSWCCDGVHCAGNDIRYAGMWDRMYAVCNQYNWYSGVCPDDPWLESEFYCLDGLTVVEG